MSERENWNRRYGRLQERAERLWTKWHDAHPANQAFYRTRYREVMQEIKGMEPQEPQP